MVFLRKHKMPMPAPLTAGAFTVLVIENDEDASRMIQAFLASQNGLKVSAARDGLSALISVGRERPDLIIFDVLIPGVDGLEVCRQIKADPKSHTAVIAIGEQPERAEAAIAAGADAFLSKPIDPETLLTHVRKLLQVM
jgi:CheY-like chemotaxis protein